MPCLDLIGDIEYLEEASFDASLVNELELRASGTEPRPIRFSTPTFK